MLPKFAIFALLFTCVLAAEDAKPKGQKAIDPKQADTRQKIRTTETQKMTFEPSAALRLDNSIGQVKIEGWTRPDVEVTITKSTKDEYDSDKSAEGAKELEKVKTSFTRKGEEIVLGTEYHHSSMPQPFRGGPPIDILYEIKMPRDARVIVMQDSGDVQLSRLSGEINATVQHGSITVVVPGDSQYIVDAKSKFGTVTSNLAKPDHGLFFFGEHLDYETPKTMHKLYLRAKSGDIVIVHSPRP